jgi:hypothetical protein
MIRESVKNSCSFQGHFDGEERKGFVDWMLENVS